MGGGTEDKAHTVMSGQLLEDIENRYKEADPKCLDLVEDDNATGDVVELAASRAPVGEEALDKLDAGRHDHRRVPVFGSKAISEVFLRGIKT